MSYIAFLDLLGTKDLSLNDCEKYFEVTTDFAKELKLAVNFECGIYYFSDCAYLKSKKLDNLINCLVQLRESLLKNNIFFTAAICEGDLGVQLLNTNKTSDLGGCIFTDASISKVYAMQSSLKGVGILIDDKIEVKDKNIRQFVFQNFYIPDIMNTNHIQVFNDILIFDKETLIGEDKENINTFNMYWQYFLRTAIQSNLKSNRFGRYYISLFTNLIESIDFSFRLFCDETTDLKKDGIKNDFAIINYLLSNESSSYLQNNFPGFGLVYLYIIKKLYKDNNYSVSTFTRLFLNKLLTIDIVKPYFNNFNNFPYQIISSKVKSCLLEDYYYVINSSNI